MTPYGGAGTASPCLAIDIGATKVEIAVVSAEGAVVFRSRLEVAAHEFDLFDANVQLATRVRRSVEFDIGVAGVACAGPMSRNGATVSPLNIPRWRDFALRDSLSSALAMRVFVEGDARALALAEGCYGAARGDSSYLSMVVSTGVGGGIVLNGRLLDGETGNAGHIGHLNVVTNGSLCSCGSYGCLEAEVSGWAIEAHTGASASQASQAVRCRTGELVGRAVGTLCSVLDFQSCYVAGSVALGFGHDFFDAANKAARTVAMMPYANAVGVFPSKLGADGPILGAALVGWRGES